MVEGAKTDEIMHKLYEELGKCSACPDLINHLVDRIQEQFEEFKNADESRDPEVLKQLIQAYTEAEEKLVKRLLQLNQELGVARKRRTAECKYLGNV